MPVTLENLQKVCGANAADLIGELYLAFKADVDTIPDATDHVVSTAITMKASKVFVKVELSKKDKSYESKPEGDEDGSIYKTLFKGFHPHLRSAATNMLAGMTNGCDVIAIFKDKNDEQRIIGDLSEGAIMKASEIISKDKNGYELELSAESALPPLFYTATIPT